MPASHADASAATAPAGESAAVVVEEAEPRRKGSFRNSSGRKSDKSTNGGAGGERVFFFDIDNCLYHKSTGIYILMGERIRDYFVQMGLSAEEAVNLHHHYFTEYGLAIRGLSPPSNEEIDPVEYDRVVDGGLPLEKILKPDPELRRMLQEFTGARKWACTNAGLAHATRVLRILGVEDQFEGITYCDYSEPDFSCKPEKAFYVKAMREAGVERMEDCFFVDDSATNVDAAKKLGWTTVHVADTLPSTHGHYQITDIHDLPKVLPEFWPNRDPSWTASEPTTSA
ncbi:hypothetical protein HDU96_009422 [Phlyctochytrium bullatum]|nr:hypothetical protein HDU96_009422 [Phlyctochytrium bullatum]